MLRAKDAVRCAVSLNLSGVKDANDTYSGTSSVTYSVPPADGDGDDDSSARAAVCGLEFNADAAAVKVLGIAVTRRAVGVPDEPIAVRDTASDAGVVTVTFEHPVPPVPFVDSELTAVIAFSSRLAPHAGAAPVVQKAPSAKRSKPDASALIVAPLPPLEGVYVIPAGGDNAAFITTFFEVSNARRAFPCPDVPEAKLKWQLSVQLPPSFGASSTVLSNTTVASMKAGSAKGGVTVNFQQTLAAIPAYTVGLFATSCAMRVARRDVDVSPYGGPSTLPLAVYAAQGSLFPVDLVLDVLERSVLLLAEFFAADDSAPFPAVSKLDAVAVPAMLIGGMEHDGLISLSESASRAAAAAKSGGKGDKSITDESLVCLVVHEVAHHWIGNMVGLPFGVKEGVCQVLEQAFGAACMGKPLRMPRKSAAAAAAATGPSSGRCSSSSRNAAEPGMELTGRTYQTALADIEGFAAGIGWDAFRAGLQRVITEWHGKYCGQEEFFQCFTA